MNSIERHFSDFSACCRANNVHQAMLANAMVSFQKQHNIDLGKADANESLYIQMSTIQNQELIIACAQGNLEIVDYLLEIGVDASLDGEEPLRQAVEFGHIDVATSLIFWGAKPSCAEGVFLEPVAKGHLEMVVFLLKNGAEVGANDYQAFRLAIRYDQDKIVNYFINHSFKHGLDLATRPEYLEHKARKNSEKNMV